MQLLRDMQKNPTKLKNINYIVRNLYGIFFFGLFSFGNFVVFPIKWLQSFFLVSQPGAFIELIKIASKKVIKSK